MKLITAAAVALLLGGCATMQQPKPSMPKSTKAAKHAEACSCSPTANQVVQKRFYDGFRVRWLH